MTGPIVACGSDLSYDQPHVLQQLQDTMRIAVVVHRAGTVIRDYYTVRMALPHMTGPMWWNDGGRVGVMERAGGEPERTITGERPLTCDYDATIILELLADAPFGVDQILNALRNAVFSLGIGQRSCIPSLPVAGEPLNAPALIDAIARGPASLIHCTPAARAVTLSHTAKHDLDMLLKTILTEAFGGAVVRPWVLHRHKGPVALIIGYSAMSAADIEARLGVALPSCGRSFAIHAKRAMRR